MKKYVIARSEWNAEEFLKDVYRGKNLKKLFDTKDIAEEFLKGFPPARQAMYQVFTVNYDERLIQ